MENEIVKATQAVLSYLSVDRKDELDFFAGLTFVWIGTLTLWLSKITFQCRKVDCQSLTGAIHKIDAIEKQWTQATIAFTTKERVDNMQHDIEKEALRDIAFDLTELRNNMSKISGIMLSISNIRQEKDFK